MADLPRFDRKMSDAEGLMWRLDRDPHLTSTFANVTVVDRPPDAARLRQRMERATWVVRRLRQRVQPVPANLSAPVWVDDPDFDIDYHFRHIALPKPGTLRQLLDLANLIAWDSFDRTRPLWQFWVVDGLRGGKGALIEKLHHTIVDGEGGVQLAMQFLDLDRDAPEPPPLDPEQMTTEQAEEAPPDLWRELLSGSLRVPLGLFRQVRDLLADPTGIPDTGSAAADTVRNVLQQLGDTDAARSPLWTARSLRRRIEVLRAPFDETRGAAKKLGGTLNTAFLTAAADAAGAYHRRLGTPVDELRASMAVSTRTEQSGTNAFSLARMLVPTGPMPIGERFAAIHAAAEDARQSSQAIPLDTIATVTATLPTALLSRITRQQAQTVDFATSNVRGSREALYLAGAKVLENYPIGPLLGVAFNLTLLSYAHSLDMAVNIDRAAVAEPELLRACLAKSFKSLAAIAD
jgi:WS/DGAT/MGAT family acyltransferase